MVDLHIHSDFSDGELSIEKIMNEAQKNRINILSITDHDNIDSIKLLSKQRNLKEVSFIPGVELSTVSYYYGDKMKVHVLGYGYNDMDKNLNQSLQEIYNRRAEDNEEYITQLIKKFSFLSGSMFDNFDYGKYGWIKQLILNQINLFICSDDRDKLIAYLDSVKPSYHNYNFNLEEAIELILNSGGYPILAHPFKLNLDNDKTVAFVKYLIDCGLTGIESYHAEANQNQVAFYNYLAKKYNLYESGGSDFHSYFYDKSLGTNYGELSDSLPLVKKLILEKKIIGGKKI